MILKKIIKRFQKLLRSNTRKPLPKTFESSSKYWEERYNLNHNSGSGSYGRLADFKAKIINQFVKSYNINNVVEFGCGDGNQLLLANYPNYIGYDVSNKAIEICERIFKKDNSKEFHLYNSKNSEIEVKAELVISLDVIYHLVEDEVFEDYMKNLFNTAKRYVIIYSSNYDDFFTAHVKCREFTKWIEENMSHDWRLKEFIKNEFPFDSKAPSNTSMADFYIYESLKK